MATRRKFLTISSSALGAIHPLAALAQDKYPSAPVKVVVPFPPGGTTDAVARILAAGLRERLGQPFVVENRPGVSGGVGSQQVARSAPDGLTLLVNNASFPLNALVMETAGKAMFKFPGEFKSIAILINVPVVLMVHPNVAAKDLKEYVALLKGNPALTHNYGMTGAGSFLHLVFEILKAEAGIKLEGVSYRGAAPMVQDLITGQIQIAGDQLPTSLGRI